MNNPGQLGAPALQEPSKNSAALFTKLHRYRFLLAKRWWVLFITLSLTVALQAWRTVSVPVRFVSVGRMMVSGQISLPGSAVYSEEAGNFYGTQEQLMQSQAVRIAAEARIQALRPGLQPCGVGISVSQQQRTSIFILQATGDQPEYTQALLDAVMQEYINAKKEMRSQKSETTLTAITDTLKVLEKEIKAEDEARIEFQKQNNVSFLETQGNSAGNYLSTIDNKLAALNTEYQLLSLLSTDQSIERQRGKTEKSGNFDSPDGDQSGLGPQAEYLRAKQELVLLKAKLAEYAQDMRPRHPKIAKINADIALQERLMETYRDQNKANLSERRDSIKLQIENLQNERKEWSAKALQLSGRMAEYETIKSKLDRSKALYDRLLTSMQAVDVNKNIDQDVVSVLETASPPSTIRPGLAKALSAAIAGGLAAGLAILFLLDVLDDRLISVSEFESQFTERVLGRIPSEVITEQCKDVAVLQSEDPRQIFAESFSNLRSSLLYLPYEGGRPKTILVTSAVPNEGKSTVSSNLATTLALGGARTLLIDCDLRRGTVHQIFGISNEIGFSDVLTEGMPWREAVRQSSITNLSIIPSGKALSRPSKDLLGGTIDEVLKQTQSEYDFVVFDSCPVLAADDTTTFAPKVDATIFVVRLSFSQRGGTRSAMQLLYDRQVNVLGVVLNGLNSKVDGYHYYSYSDYYYSKPA
ncbi:MAG: polysaccharide biosynthesis tyrosine autokinase [Verrucomicrobiota bacterium]